ncbi:MAG: 4Fe-4S dicluster domain-containing protein [Archaeoglobaceae archaeon]|nr:4Fe-4S dicluster domain-containing protein [Archaeoglobaceae archaeon]MDW8118626.1 4Fe-4S dicluster domain-containing protein [Archaeoglobaceae archaeon]
MTKKVWSVVWMVSRSEFISINPEVNREVFNLGGKSLLECYQCGSCTAVCPLSEELDVSFRRAIRYTQLGVEDKILGDISPWSCNLHGDCTDSCPRGASPSEILASIRRYQSIKYDWTGITKWWNYSSFASKFLAYLAIFGLSLLLYFGLYWQSILEYASTGKLVVLSKLLIPVAVVFVISFAILASNGYRAYKFMSRDKKKEVGLMESLKLISRFFLKLETEAMGVPHKRDRILEHVLILVGIGLFILLGIIYLIYPKFFDYEIISRALIYTASLTLLIGVSSPLTKRLLSSEKTHWYYKRFTHSVDWMSLITLFPIALMALLVFILYDLSMVLYAYIAFALLLSFLIPFLLLEFAFGKHTHWLYKVIAYYVGARTGSFRGE